MDKSYNYLLNLLNENDSVVVAVSGGPDSMALLHLLTKIKEKVKIEIICAHVNHNTGRIGQDEEENYVKEYCQKNNIIFELLKIEKYSCDNFENEARIKRYDFFDKLIKKYNSKYLLTAHHGDDLVETILMRIVRGSTLKGYAGIKKEVEKENYKIIRPLIEITKEDILKYLDENDIKYYIDYTNLADVHTRNRYRKYILPELKKENEKVHEKFYKMSKLLLMYDNYITKEVEKIINNVYDDNKLEINKFNALDDVIQLKIIEYILEQKYKENINLITSNHVELIFNLIKSEKANIFISLPLNINVKKEYNIISFEKKDLIQDNYDIEFENEAILPLGKIIKLTDSKEKSNFICRLNEKDISLPLRIRTRKKGDKMKIKNMAGRKKINDIFINEKVPLSKRVIWPIVVDSNDEIIWLPGLKKSKYDVPISENCDIILKYIDEGR